MKKIINNIIALCFFALSVQISFGQQRITPQSTLRPQNTTSQSSPQQLYPGLFEEIQLKNIFPDNKTFVDARPKFEPAAIMKLYNQSKDRIGFNLKAFVTSEFDPPIETSNAFKSIIGAGIRAHIDTLWKVLYRHHDTINNTSLLPLKFDYIIPGGRFREIYYWDSYFTMLGLHESKKIDVIENMIMNFSDLIDRYGFIPNGTRTYYLTRSQPPFFSMMLDILASEKGDSTYIHYNKELLKEYAFWMHGADTIEKGHAFSRVVRLTDGEILNRYYDNSDRPREESFKQDVQSFLKTKEKPEEYYRNIRAAAESGWDFSTRWFDSSGQLSSIHTTDLVPIDLNCLLYHLELSIAKSFRLKGEKTNSEIFTAKALARKNAILKYCWSESNGWFMDYNFEKHQAEKIETLAGTYPLEFQIASASQAKKIAFKIENKFLMPGGLVTTTNRSGQQWDSPNGWAPLQYMTIDGLSKYKFNSLARTIAYRWINLNIQVFQQTGKLVEKYNVIDMHLKAGGGEYLLQDGFGWTNGVLLHLMNRFPNPGVNYF